MRVIYDQPVSMDVYTPCDVNCGKEYYACEHRQILKSYKVYTDDEGFINPEHKKQVMDANPGMDFVYYEPDEV